MTPTNGSLKRTASEITSLRDEIGDLVAELDRRRHEALDLRLQIRKHPVIAGAVVTVAALIAGGLLAAAVRARRKREDRLEKVRSLRKAFGRMARHPEEFAREPGVVERVAMSVLVVAATTFAKKMIERKVPA